MSDARRSCRCIARFLAIAAAAILGHHSGAIAHEARPAYLELTETLPDRYDVVWRTPVSAGQRLPVVLQLPDGVTTVVEPRLREFADSVVERRIIAAPGGLGGCKRPSPMCSYAYRHAMARARPRSFIPRALGWRSSRPADPSPLRART